MSDTQILEVRADQVQPGDYLMSGYPVMWVVPCGAVLANGTRRAVDIQWDQPVPSGECMFDGEWLPRCNRFTQTHGMIRRADQTVRIVR